MNEQIVQILLSQPAILIYEVLVMAVLLFWVIRLTKQRKQRKKENVAMQEQQKWQTFENSLRNEKRTNC